MFSDYAINRSNTNDLLVPIERKNNDSSSRENSLILFKSEEILSTNENSNQVCVTYDVETVVIKTLNGKISMVWINKNDAVKA
ncbi:26159_t:CDS:2 [Gigaspora margarita]|uniref:26159_t:CDS:1 n=1 Tax=Gigaspora margarita TaxID=4874 RepID=A0ABM8W2D2_GIGMA|nr:26159_t:CDS:2 [Gigaspora margarita]